MRVALVLTTSLLMGGCAATHTLPDPKLNGGQDYLPPINVMVDAPDHSYQLRNYLRESGVFSKVESGTASGDGTQVMVNLKAEHKVASTPILLLSACTLFLLPIQSDLDTTADFSVMRNGTLIKRYHYQNYTTKYAWLLDLGIPDRQENIRRVARTFARDVQADGNLDKPTGANQ